ncbi:MAG: 30S ribosomal protein S10 [Rickettsiales bacterium]|nr:30S ribosomal protein S10 [Rickettsiales bacterium]
MSPGLSSLYQVKLKLTCGDLELLKRFEKEVSSFLDKTSSYTFVRLPGRRRLNTVLRSPHVNKKSREQFSFETYSSCYTLNDPSNTCIKGLLKRLRTWYGGEYVLSFCERYGERGGTK